MLCKHGKPGSANHKSRSAERTGEQALPAWGQRPLKLKRDTISRPFQFVWYNTLFTDNLHFADSLAFANLVPVYEIDVTEVAEGELSVNQCDGFGAAKEH